MSRTGQFIYLKTRGSLEIDETTRQVHSFVCVNSLVSDEEGRRLVRDMKKKFSAIVSEAELSAMESDVPAVENPQKLERAILNLITNLNNQSSYDDDNVSLISDSTTENDDTRRAKSPPLAIIPPKTNSIKPSLFKATAVLGHATKCQSPSIKDEPKSPEISISQPTTPLNIKTEPTVNILSPTSSSMSSVDSDVSSPFLSNTQHLVTTIASTTNSRKQTANISPNNANKVDELFNPTYDIETSLNTTTKAANDSILIASKVNNNNSNNNRNSVLKRTYSSGMDDDDNDYPELVKKRTLNVPSNLNSPLQSTPTTTLDLLATSGSGKC
mgnify:CR=1 FL=1